MGGGVMTTTLPRHTLPLVEAVARLEAAGCKVVDHLPEGGGITATKRDSHHAAAVVLLDPNAGFGNYVAFCRVETDGTVPELFAHTDLDVAHTVECGCRLAGEITLEAVTP